MNTMMKTRFAPSPTGLMHFGNLRTALFNYLFAKRQAGSCFLLRIEDTDISRSERHYTEAILRDLHWLGLEWQEGPYYQSERQAIYNTYYQELQEKGIVYPCFCTEEQLAITRKVQLAALKPPRYPGTCRHLTDEQVNAKKAANIPFTLRFKIQESEKIEFMDLIKGPQHFDASQIGDFIVRRSDGSASFMFCNAIDDALMGITHALRGDDHLTNTPRQILILKALKLSMPHYGHFPTILGPDSRPLSKRNGSRSVQELREAGYLPLGILNYLSRLGHYNADLSLKDVEGLSQTFDLHHISHAPAHFDPNQLNFWQKEAMRNMTWQDCWELMPAVKEWVPVNAIQNFVEAVQPNLMMPQDAVPWAKIIFTENFEVDKPDVLKVIEEAGKTFFKEALDICAASGLHYASLVEGLQQRTGRKGKAIFFPLRAALTGELHGPELAKILVLLGMKKIEERLKKAMQLC